MTTKVDELHEAIRQNARRGIWARIVDRVLSPMIPDIEPTVTVSAQSLVELLEDNAWLRCQRQELQESISGYVEKRRALDKRAMVSAFHRKFGHPIGETPHIPDDQQVKFRLSLIMEEALEIVCAATSSTDKPRVQQIAADVMAFISTAKISVNLPEFTDGLSDLEYVLEGSRVVFGIDGTPIFLEVHRANMEKTVLQVTSKDEAVRRNAAKPIKPSTWKAPDIIGSLIAQGWSCSD